MRFVLTPHALARTRFTISPLAELIGALSSASAALDEPRRRLAPGIGADENLDAFRRWRAGDPVRAGFSDLIGHTKWFPDFVGLAPAAHGEPTLESELAQLAAWDPLACVATLDDSAREAWTPQNLDWVRAPGLPGLLAEHLRSAWEALVAPDWARRQGVLRREIAFRTALIGTAGWAGAISGIARDVHWEDPDTLVVSLRTQRRTVVDEHVTFIPTTQVRGRWTCDGPHGVALVYGARGSRAAVSDRRGLALGRLLGTGRAAVLLALDLPATPSQLRDALGLALGTIGGHLRVLEDAGLVHRARTGREVYYRRTPLGENLVQDQQ